MFLFLCIVSISYLLNKIFPLIPLQFKLLGIFIFVTNSYILLLVSGGQMGIALAYSITPLVSVSFIKIAVQNLKLSIITGILFSIQVMFDIRIAYITITAIILYLILHFIKSKETLRSSLYILIYSLVIPLGITGLLHAFWLLPLLFSGTSSINQQLGDIYTTTEAVKFFSFAKLENSLSLLHPNWPENIFGKVGFMKPEFLALPIVAYLSLLFINSKFKIQNSNSKIILFFALLGLVGAFLAKGASEPFGQVYIWLFEYVPGFVMFRDPTKWYLFIAISYAVLLPFSVWKIWEKMSGKSLFKNLFLILIILYLLFLIRP